MSRIFLKSCTAGLGLSLLFNKVNFLLNEWWNKWEKAINENNACY